MGWVPLNLVEDVASPPVTTATVESTPPFSVVESPTTTKIPGAVLHEHVMDWLQETVGVPPANAATSAGPPTKEEISLLREAFAAFYGANRDAVAAESLLSQTLEAWQRQPPDERAGLYRVRGDCYMVRVYEGISAMGVTIHDRLCICIGIAGILTFQ